MIAVMGATGHTGTVVAGGLLKAGKQVRVIGRSADRLAPFVQRGAQPAAGDAASADFLASAFAGGEAVYAMIPPDYAQPDPRAYYNRLGEAIERAIRQSGIRRVVFLSSLGAELREGTGPILGLHDVEERLKTLGLDLRILRPGYFYENFFGNLGLIKHQGINGGAIEPEVPVPMVAAADIGAAAAEELAGSTFGAGASVRELLGPRDYTMREATRLIGEKIGKPDLRYVRFPDADFKGALTQMGFSAGLAASFVEMSRALSEGRVKSLQGRTKETTMPTAFEAFADLFAAAYRSA